MGEDFTLPPEVAEEIPRGVAVLADEPGRLLLLPYSGDAIACVDLAVGTLAYPVISLLRLQEEGLRTASVRLLPGRGVLHLTESSICLFDEALDLAWRRDGNFIGTFIEGVQNGAVMLLASDWTGRETRERVSLSDGERIT